MKLAGKAALITGAGTGIGAATARRMAKEGALVAVCGIPENCVNAVAKELCDSGATAIAITADVADAEQVESAVARTVAEFGSLDIAVANAGIQLHAEDVNLHSLPEEIWDRTHNVNYRGVYLTCKYSLAQMITQETGGVITIVSSVAGLGGASHNVAYSAGKHGLIGIARNIAVHYAKHGIRCNAVCPGPLEQTPNWDAHDDPVGRTQRLLQSVPLGRLGTPDDIAPLITFLSTADASFINGAVYVVDGGLTAR